MATQERVSRWDSKSKNNIPGLPTPLSANLTTAQIDSYVLHMRIEEINRKLRVDDVLPKVERRKRSVSPEPIYGADGKRVNTRIWRYREKLEEERIKLSDIGVATIPGFKAVGDFRRLNKVNEKLYIPDKDYSHINFIGLLIGPRGNTLKKMEADSGAKISIRGKGSVKEGKNRGETGLMPGEEEELHCLVTADSEEKVKKALETIKNIINQAISCPDGSMELKKVQLRELAALNGTLRDEDTHVCQNCGEVGHRRYDCPHEKNFTSQLICKICGTAGHLERDCKERNNPIAVQAAQKRELKLNSEYQSFISELGGSNNPQVTGMAYQQSSIAQVNIFSS